MPPSRQAAPIAYRLISSVHRAKAAKLLAFEDLAAAHAAMQALEKEFGAEADLSGLHPAHAVMIRAENDLALIASKLGLLPELARLVDMVAGEEERLLPSGPPMSPLTTSFFMCWSLFDAAIGPGRESFTTIAIALAEAGVIRIHPTWRALWTLLQQSHMGIYLHEGAEGECIRLRDLITGEGCAALVPSGYVGHAGELWYVRVLPPPAHGLPHVALTTPYVLISPGRREWQAYFHRTVPDVEASHNWRAYRRHMKFGPTRFYWNEFVFEAYVNYRPTCVYLEGLPDVASSRPHSREREREAELF